MRVRTLAAAFVSAGCIVSPALLGDVVSIGALKDNTLYEDPFGTISNGQGDGLFVGRTARTGLIRRGLIAFDVAASVPAGSTITKVELTMNVTRAHGSTATIRLHPALANWGEGASAAGSSSGGAGDTALPGDATWLHTFGYSQFWANAGGDYNPVSSATKGISGEGQYTWASTPSMVANAQSWLNTPTTNFGWLMRAATEVSGTAKRFATSEHLTAAWQPKLLIEYTPPPVCGSADFDGDGDSGTDLDIEAFFACLGGTCCATCGSSDFDGDGDAGTDLDIEAFFRVLGGGNC